MAQYIIGDGGGGKMQGLAEAVKFFLGQREKRREQESAMEEMQRRERAAEVERRVRVAAGEMGQIHPSQRRDYLGRLDPEVRAYFNDFAELQAPVYTDAEKAEQVIASKRLGAYQDYEPDGFEKQVIGYHGITGTNPNETTTKTVRDKSYMTPEQWDQNVAEGFVPPSDAAKNRAAADKDAADATFTRGVKTEKERAETGKVRAETGKIGEEAITERESRDPNSPTSKAKANSAGRKPAVQQAVEDINARLRKASEDEGKLLVDLEGETSASKKKSIEARLASVRRIIQENLQRRDRLIAGATKNGARVTQPAAPKPDPLGIR